MSDMLSSYLALSGVLMALLRRETTGLGDYLDISMHESVLAASPNILGPVFGGDEAPDRFNERSHGGGAMLNVYRTADDRFLALGGGEHKFVQALFEGLGRPEFIEAVCGPAGPGHREAIAFLRASFSERSLADWEAWFSGRDICWSPVLDLKEAWEQDHVTERHMRVTDEDGNHHIGIPVKFAHEPGAIRPKPPKMGADTVQILSELDLTEAQRRAILGEL
jgi:crotonobetainyl-CoA:carnitine CoA-transferase CaiB-like acyl-CoA transferase